MYVGLTSDLADETFILVCFGNFIYLLSQLLEYAPYCWLKITCNLISYQVSLRRVMCGSNRWCTTPLSGKGGDITLFRQNIDDSPWGRAELRCDTPAPRADLVREVPGVGISGVVMSRLFPDRGVVHHRFEPHIIIGTLERPFVLSFFLHPSKQHTLSKQLDDRHLDEKKLRRGRPRRKKYHRGEASVEIATFAILGRNCHPDEHPRWKFQLASSCLDRVLHIRLEKWKKVEIFKLSNSFKNVITFLTLILGINSFMIPNLMLLNIKQSFDEKSPVFCGICLAATYVGRR